MRPATDLRPVPMMTNVLHGSQDANQFITDRCDNWWTLTMALWRVSCFTNEIKPLGGNNKVRSPITNQGIQSALIDKLDQSSLTMILQSSVLTGHAAFASECLVDQMNHGLETWILSSPLRPTRAFGHERNMKMAWKAWVFVKFAAERSLRSIWAQKQKCRTS